MIRRRSEGASPGPWYANVWVHLLTILVVAAAFRFWRIGDFPPGLFGDEATNGLDALDVLAGRGAVFFPANYGREGLHIWLLAGMFRVFGISQLAIRLPSAVAGTLTALATYWLGLELARADPRDAGSETQGWRSHIGRLRFSQPIALVAALYTATSFWHVHFSRFGVRGVFTPLFGALAGAAFWRAVNVWPRDPERHRALRRYAWFALSGCFLGLSAHFYTAGRLLPVFLGIFLLAQAIVASARGKPEAAILRRHLRGIAVLYGAAAVVFAPLAIYFLQHPGSFTERAGEVAVIGAENPLMRFVQAATANIAQFVLPGRGDVAQFYNLPGRPVFDLLTAILAVVGLVLLLAHLARPAALFVVTWCGVMLVPSFLATDRFPTLPRVLGVIPAVYFLPATGLVFVATVVTAALHSAHAHRSGDLAAGEPSRARGAARGMSIAAAVCGMALLTHAALAARDYFIRWAPSAATFDAFEGDMTAAWQWLRSNEPVGHIYLSSDIYRHPTFMLLNERATVRTYFVHQNPELSWFDARGSLPLPPPGEPATYLLGSSALPTGPGEDFLARWAGESDRLGAPDGRPALLVYELTAPQDAAAAETAGIKFLPAPIAFSDHLVLEGVGMAKDAGGPPEIRLLWRTTGPVPGDWRGYDLEVSADGGSTTNRSGTFRPPEWVPGGSLITWHLLPSAPETPISLALRMVRAADETPFTTAGAPDGWHRITIP